MQLKVRSRAARYVGNAVDLANWAPPRIQRTSDDGEMIFEHPPTVASCKMVNPAGFVVYVPLQNGMGRPSPNDPYRLQIGAEKLEKGFLPYGDCPIGLGLSGNLPAKFRDRPPCRMAADGHPIGDEHPCECVVAAIEARSNKQTERMAEDEIRRKPKDARELDQRDKAIEKLSDAIMTLNERNTGGKKRKGSDEE